MIMISVMKTARSWLLGLILIPFLDFVWLGNVARHWYRVWLSPWARFDSQGKMQVDWLAAGAVYLLLATGLQVFAVARSDRPRSAMLSGALLGLVTYGVFEFTNRSFILDWPYGMIWADLAWGVVLCGIVAGVMRKVSA